jgi:hypothetical protein
MNTGSPGIKNNNESTGKAYTSTKMNINTDKNVKKKDEYDDDFEEPDEYASEKFETDREESAK